MSGQSPDRFDYFRIERGFERQVALPLRSKLTDYLISNRRLPHYTQWRMMNSYQPLDTLYEWHLAGSVYLSRQLAGEIDFRQMGALHMAGLSLQILDQYKEDDELEVTTVRSVGEAAIGASYETLGSFIEERNRAHHIPAGAPDNMLVHAERYEKALQNALMATVNGLPGEARP